MALSIIHPNLVAVVRVKNPTEYKMKQNVSYMRSLKADGRSTQSCQNQGQKQNVDMQWVEYPQQGKISMSSIWLLP